MSGTPQGPAGALPGVMALESRPSFACLTFIATKGASVEPCPGLSPGQGRQRGCHRQRTGSVTTEEARLVTSSKLKVTSSRSTVPGSSSSVTGTISWALARSTSRSGKWPPGAERFASEIGAVSGERHAYPLGGFPGAAVSENRAFSSDGGRAWGEEGGSSSHCADESRSGGWWVRGAEAGQGRDAYSDGSASTGGQGPGAREGNGAMAAAAHETVEGEGEGVGEGEGIEEGDVDFRGRATWTNKYLLVIAYDGTYFAGDPPPCSPPTPSLSLFLPTRLQSHILLNPHYLPSSHSPRSLPCTKSPSLSPLPTLSLRKGTSPSPLPSHAVAHKQWTVHRR